MYVEGGNFVSFFLKIVLLLWDVQMFTWISLIHTLQMIRKEHLWSGYLQSSAALSCIIGTSTGPSIKKIVLRRSYKLLPACVVYWTGSSFISGYSMSSGRFISAHSSHLYVAGSPRSDDSRGKVSNFQKYAAARRGYISTVLLPNLFCMLLLPPLSPIFLYLIDDDIA